jgi:FAD/FMN-containing dehydrogenase
LLRSNLLSSWLAFLLSASQQGRALSLAGKRHAMGGQQFGSDTDLIDMTSFNKINSLDKHSGIIEVEAGHLAIHHRLLLE